MEEDCSEDMVVVVVVVRVWLLLLTMMTMTTVPIGDLGNSDLRFWEVGYGWTWLFDKGWYWGSQVGKRERELVWMMRSDQAAGGTKRRELWMTQAEDNHGDP